MAQLSCSHEVTLINTGTAASYFASHGQSSYTASKAVANMLLDQLHAGTFLAAFKVLTILLSYRDYRIQQFTGL